MTISNFKYASVPNSEHGLGEVDVESVAHLEVVSGLETKQNSKIQNLSVSTTSHCGVPTETTQPEEEDGLNSSLWNQIKGWTSMALAMIACASIGPAFRYMIVHNVPACLGAVWRSQTMILSLLPFALLERYSKPENRIDWFSYKPDLPYPLIVHVLIAGASWAAGLLLWIVGLRFISTYKASVIATCHPILLVVFLRLTGKEVSMYEWVGVFVAFSGVLVSNFSNFIEGDSAEDPTMAADMSKVPIHLQMVGFLLCIFSAASEVAVIINRIKTRKYVPLLQYTVATTFVVLFSAWITSMILENTRMFDITDQSISFCFEDNCVFGWMSHYWRWRMLIFGLWVGAVCITGFNYAMSYIPPLVFSSLSLLDPTLTALLSWMFALEGLPSVYSWIGGLVVIGGVAVIMYGEKKRESSHNYEKSELKIQSAATESESDDDEEDHVAIEMSNLSNDKVEVTN